MKKKLSILLIVAFLITSVLYLPSYAGSTKVKLYSDIGMRYEDANKVFSPQYNPFVFNPKKPQTGVLDSIKPFDNSKPITDWSNIETVPNFMNKLMGLFPTEMVKGRFIFPYIKNDTWDTATVFGLKKEGDYAYVPKNPKLDYQYAKNVQIVPWTMQMLEPKPMTRRDMAVLLARTLQYFSPMLSLTIDTSLDGAMTTQGKNEYENPPMNQSDFGNFGLSFYGMVDTVGFPLFYATDVPDDDLIKKWVEKDPKFSVYIINEKKEKKKYPDQFKIFKAYIYPQLPDKIKQKYNIIFNWKAYRGNFRDLYAIQPADVSACVTVWMIGLMDTKNGYFKPYDFVTKQEAQNVLQRMQKLIQKMYKLELKQPWQWDLRKDNVGHPIKPIFHPLLGLGGNFQFLTADVKKRMEEARKKEDLFLHYGAVPSGDAFQMNVQDRFCYIWNFDFRPDLKKVPPPPVPKPKNPNLLYIDPFIPSWFYDLRSFYYKFLGEKIDQRRLYINSENNPNKNILDLFVNLNDWWKVNNFGTNSYQIEFFVSPLVLYNVNYKNIDKEMPVRTDGHMLGDKNTYLQSKYFIYVWNLVYRDFDRCYSYMEIGKDKKIRFYDVDALAVIQNRIDQIKKYKIVSEAHVYHSPSCPEVGLIRIIYYPPTDINWLKSKGLTTGKWYDIYYTSSVQTLEYLYSRTDIISGKLQFIRKGGTSGSSVTPSDVVSYYGVFLDQ